MSAPRKRAAKKAPAKKAAASRTRAPRKSVTRTPKPPAVPPPPPAPDAHEAHQLKVKGYSWHEIATKLGYPGPVQANLAVQAHLADAAIKRDAAAREAARQLQIDRYESVVRQWWTAGTVRKDEKAAAVLLKALGSLDKLYGLDETDPTGGKPAQVTVIVGGSESEYVAQLKELAGVPADRVVDAEVVTDGEGPSSPPPGPNLEQNLEQTPVTGAE